jgi:hypothetical protein
MGVGSTNGTNGFSEGSNALWTINNFFGPRPAMGPDWVAFPPPGYVPYQIVIISNPGTSVISRWSLSRNIEMADFPIDSASVDFSIANVTMTQADQNVPLNVVSRTDRFGDATIVWEFNLSTFTVGASDRTYNVSVSNVIVNGVPENYSYDVILFDPGAVESPIYQDGFESLP